MISSLYALAMQLRNAAYDRGLFRAHDAGVPVVSVGNITAGGTGKTPVVEALIGRLLDAGRRPAMVTRGYRRESRGLLVVSDGAGRLRGVRESGDEPSQVAAKYPRVPVIADEKRIRGCRYAVAEFDADILLLDDAFQHRAVARACDIVVVDARVGLDGLRMLPKGRLREPLGSLARADVILLSRCADVDHGRRLREALRPLTAAPVFATRFAVQDFGQLPTPAGDDPPRGRAVSLPLEKVQGTRVFAFCGIGSPGSFTATLRETGLDVAGQRDFPDHHWYTAADIDALWKDAASVGADALCTTEKDAVRLQALPDAAAQGAAAPGTVLFPRVALEFLEGEEEFMDVLWSRTGGAAAS